MIQNPGGAAEKKYKITLSGKALSTNPESPSAGARVNVSANPRVEFLTITAATMGDIPYARESIGNYRFIMPADDITISAD